MTDKEFIEATDAERWRYCSALRTIIILGNNGVRYTEAVKKAEADLARAQKLFRMLNTIE